MTFLFQRSSRSKHWLMWRNYPSPWMYKCPYNCDIMMSFSWNILFIIQLGVLIPSLLYSFRNLEYEIKRDSNIVACLGIWKSYVFIHKVKNTMMTAVSCEVKDWCYADVKHVKLSWYQPLSFSPCYKRVSICHGMKSIINQYQISRWRSFSITRSLYKSSIRSAYGSAWFCDRSRWPWDQRVHTWTWSRESWDLPGTKHGTAPRKLGHTRIL